MSTPDAKRKSKTNSRTAARLALQSAANNPNTNTGKHLTQFGKSSLKSSPKSSDESLSKAQKKSDPEGNTTTKNPVKLLWSKLTGKIFSKKSAEKSKKDEKIDDSKQQTVISIEKDLTDNNKKITTTPSPKIEETKSDTNKPKKMDSSPESVAKLNVQNKTSAEVVDDKIDSLDWKKLCVELRNVGYKYPRSKHKEPQLKDVNMSIPKSAIYGLLGPSGCGKTTLLKIIVGRINPNGGYNNVNGLKPNTKGSTIPGVGVGYMPQEIALYPEFTIEETLSYYGTIYGMLANQIRQRILFLVEFLDLPEPTRLVDHLSGGQKRRVSLAAALVHNPPLLILDEPTVGVDPLLRERIWDHLMVLADREKTTILITTHYIDEAKRANIVALMREGSILIEHSPQFLMNHFKVPNLEDVFLKVCRYGQNETTYTMPQNYVDSRKSVKKVLTKHLTGKKSETVISADIKPDDDENIKKNFSDEDIKRYSPNKKLFVTSNSKIMCALIRKSFLRLRRNIPLLLFQLALPTIQIILFCVCIGKTPFGLTLAVNNQENLTDFPVFSPMFINKLDSKTIKLKDYDSMDTAIQSVKDTHSWGAIVVKPNFTKSLITRATATGYIIDDSDIESSTINYYGDFSDMLISQSIVGELIAAQQHFLAELVELYGNFFSNLTNPRATENLVKFVEPPVYGNLSPSFRDFMAPGIILTICYFLATGLTSIAIIIERREGILDRTLVAGVKPYHIVLNSLLVNFVIVMMQAAILLLFALWVFGITCRGPVILVIILVLLQGFGGIAFGLFISTICDKEETAIMLGLGSFYPMLLLSGILWPLEAMPATLRVISYFLPHTLAVISLRNIMLRGWGLAYFAVVLGFISTIAWIVIFLILAIIIVSFIRR